MPRIKDILPAVLAQRSDVIDQALSAALTYAGDHIDRITVGERVLRGGQDEAYGGQGLSLSLQLAVYEMLTSANLAWASAFCSPFVNPSSKPAA